VSEPGLDDATFGEPVAAEIDTEGVGPVPVKRLLATAATAIGPLVLYFLLPLEDRIGRVIAIVLVIGVAGLLIPLSVHQARRVLHSDYPLLEAVRCLTSGLVLLVVSFSASYFVLGTEYENQIDGIETKLDALYYTVTVLATVGFGDIAATGQVARAFVTAQMVINFAILAVALRLVSWALKERGNEAFGRHQQRLRTTPPPPRRRRSPT
jgi:hypothetical protein